jgi:hypothetical protein
MDTACDQDPECEAVAREVDMSADTPVHLVDDPGRDLLEQFVRQVRSARGHEVDGLDGGRGAADKLVHRIPSTRRCIVSRSRDMACRAVGKDS